MGNIKQYHQLFMSNCHTFSRGYHFLSLLPAPQTLTLASLPKNCVMTEEPSEKIPEDSALSYKAPYCSSFPKLDII